MFENWRVLITRRLSSPLNDNNHHRRRLPRLVEALEPRVVLDAAAQRLAAVWSATAPGLTTNAEYSTDLWMVQLDENAARTVNSLNDVSSLLSQGNVEIRAVRGLGAVGLVAVVAQVRGPATAASQSLSVDDRLRVEAVFGANPAIRTFGRDGNVAAQLDPNDESYLGQALVGLKNGGLNGATADADIDADEAWDITTGSSNVVVAVIDSGVDYSHPDLYLNIWLNPGELPSVFRSRLVDTNHDGLITFRDLNQLQNAVFVTDFNRTGYIDGGDLLADPRWANGIDEDGNGRVDDLIGWDFRDNDNDPLDRHGHGTHIAGTIGAVGNNARGVVGVSWASQIMPLRFLDQVAGQGLVGSRTDAISAINYTTNLAIAGVPVRVSNNSWGTLDSFDPILRSTIESNGDAGVLFVAAAGNSESRTGRGLDLDRENIGFYPATFDLENILSVAASDTRDSLATFSQYGTTSVDLAAPGVSILNTDLRGTYSYRNGTSMAAPHVSGAAALLFSRVSNATPLEVRRALMESVDVRNSLVGKVATGGRLNAR